MRKVFTHMNSSEIPMKGTVISAPSETIPDQAISPQELLRRYSLGQPLGLKNVEPVYDEDGEIPEFYKMDKLDRLHALQSSSEKVVEIKERFDREQQLYKAEKAKQQAEQADKQKGTDQADKAGSERSDSEAD